VSRARAGIAAIGRQWNAQANADTVKLYADLQRGVATAGIKTISNLSYGPHAQQKLDLFVPEQGFSEPGPVLVYLHGGELSRGDKIAAGSDGLIYSNVGKFMARLGGVGINANYRLLPDAKWPSGAEDVRLLLTWIQKNIAPYGGNPKAVLVLSDSVGATHLATYLFHESEQLADGPGIAGAVLGSGVFDATADTDDARAYFGRNTAHLPLNLVDSYQGKAVPILLWSTQYDVANIETGVGAMYAKLCRKYQDCPMFVQLPGHNSASPAMSIDSADRSVVNSLVAFYHTAVR
jgi:triacylglycerol lipase